MRPGKFLIHIEKKKKFWEVEESKVKQIRSGVGGRGGCRQRDKEITCEMPVSFPRTSRHATTVT